LSELGHSSARAPAFSFPASTGLSSVCHLRQRVPCEAMNNRSPTSHRSLKAAHSPSSRNRVAEALQLAVLPEGRLEPVLVHSSARDSGHLRHVFPTWKRWAIVASPSGTGPCGARRQANGSGISLQSPLRESAKSGWGVTWNEHVLASHLHSAPTPTRLFHLNQDIQCDTRDPVSSGNSTLTGSRIRALRKQFPGDNSPGLNP
jgi:hypothetical protein